MFQHFWKTTTALWTWKVAFWKELDEGAPASSVFSSLLFVGTNGMLASLIFTAQEWMMRTATPLWILTAVTVLAVFGFPLVLLALLGVWAWLLTWTSRLLGVFISFHRAFQAAAYASTAFLAAVLPLPGAWWVALFFFFCFQIKGHSVFYGEGRFWIPATVILFPAMLFLMTVGAFSVLFRVF